MSKLNEKEILDYLLSFKRIYDNKKSNGYIVDTTNFTSSNFYRALGDNDTDEYLNQLIYEEFDSIPTDASLKRINKMLTFETKKSGNEDSINFRVKSIEKAIYINLGNGSTGKITANKFYIKYKSPIKFAINSSLGKMVMPDIDNGDLKLLKKYIPVKSSDFKLILVFIFNCFFTDTHYVMLLLTGPAGSAKSFITKVLKTIIDPSEVTLRNQITKVEDLVLAAEHSHLQRFQLRIVTF